MIECAIYFAGIVTGVAVCRYGMGLGFKAIYQAKEDMPLLDRSSNETWQENTDDEPTLQQEKTEDL